METQAGSEASLGHDVQMFRIEWIWAALEWEDSLISDREWPCGTFLCVYSLLGAGLVWCITLILIFFEYRQSELRTVRGGGPARWTAGVR